MDTKASFLPGADINDERTIEVPKLLENLPKNTSKEDQAYLKKYGEKLSDSTQYAKWISGSDDHEDHPGQSLVTRNHEVIERWAEERGAKPATVPGTQRKDTLGVLRFDFPGYGGKDLEEITWDEWFRTFDERQLVFLFQERLKNGNQSNFFRLESPLREDA
ncbi:MAG: hypothetical protein ACE15E_01335 [Acidobacteriota bacterium]